MEAFCIQYLLKSSHVSHLQSINGAEKGRKLMEGVRQMFVSPNNPVSELWQQCWKKKPNKLKAVRISQGQNINIHRGRGKW